VRYVRRTGRVHRLSTAQIEMKTKAMDGHRFSDADVRSVFGEMDRRVTAALSRCKRGEVVSIPRIYTNQYCDFGKHIENEGGGMAACVKR
jgi:hypothetical protein